MILLIFVLLVGRALYDLLRRLGGTAKERPSAGVFEALTSRRTSLAAGYVLGLVVLDLKGFYGWDLTARRRDRHSQLVSPVTL
jgi:hypothetical protein